MLIETGVSALRSIAHILKGFVTLAAADSAPGPFPAPLSAPAPQDLASDGSVVVPVAIQFEIVHDLVDARDALGNELGLIEVR